MNMVRVWRRSVPVLFIVCAVFAMSATPCTAAENMLDEFVSGSAAFGTSLFQAFARQSPDENLIYSPLSVLISLAMVRMGAEGQTAAEIDKAMRLPSEDAATVADLFHGVLAPYKQSSVLRVANRVYTKFELPLKPFFVNLLSEKFGSQPERVHFERSSETAEAINKWVAQQTNGHIKDLVSPALLNEDTEVVLVNAVHFKGDWVHPFREQATRDAPFYLNEHDSVLVPMMHIKERFLYGEFPELEAAGLEMPYKNSNLSMFILLPNSRTGLAKLQEKLATVSLAELRKSMEKVRVNVQLPKFKAEFQVELNEPLKEMGMKRMFADNAQFGRMYEGPGKVKVSNVIHKAFIEVNELGTEAAAATEVHVRTVRSVQNSVEFIAERPFLYVIASQDAASLGPLFVGSFCTAHGEVIVEHDEL